MLAALAGVPRGVGEGGHRLTPRVAAVERGVWRGNQVPASPYGGCKVGGEVKYRSRRFGLCDNGLVVVGDAPRRHRLVGCSGLDLWDLLCCGEVVGLADVKWCVVW